MKLIGPLNQRRNRVPNVRDRTTTRKSREVPSVRSAMWGHRNRAQAGRACGEAFSVVLDPFREVLSGANFDKPHAGSLMSQHISRRVTRSLSASNDIAQVRYKDESCTGAIRPDHPRVTWSNGKPILELRRRRSDRRHDNQRFKKPAEAKHARHSAAIPRHTNAACERRIRQDATRQQQCILSRQRDFVGKLGSER